MERGAPVFVKIADYKDVLEVVGLLNDKLEKAKEIMERINELKNEEDTELELWQAELDEIERKLSFIDKSLFKPEL
ncbi:hypothetical protein A3K72_04040 [Candidatus Woesearchaeota archaeon RBG_13_36_6]|nr:MAG: hypothetical protein A3K72_04040 [Candidatus Woesearchaeota archaeon RBG_13_36_6]